MKQRGRGLGSAGTVPERPKAPAGMDLQRTAIWDGIVGSLPEDWFPMETLPLLEAYVNRIQCVRQLERDVQQELDKLPADRNLTIMLGTAQFIRAEISSMQRLATALRLSQHSQQSPDKTKRSTKPIAWQQPE